MAEHLTDQEIEVYRRGEGDPGNRRMLAGHIAICQPCLERVMDSEHSLLAVNALTEAFLPAIGDPPFHLSHAELKNYVAGSSAKADQIICESHIQICEQCDNELQLLATTAQTAQSFARSKSNWGFLTPTRLAASIALIGLLALAFLIWRQTSSRPTPSQATNKGVQEAPKTGPQPGTEQPPIAEATPQLSNESLVSEATVVASLKDNGREIRLDHEGSVTGLEGFDESSQKLVKAALAGEGLAKPAVLDELSSPTIKLLGEPADEHFRIIGPAGEVIAEVRPTMRWRPVSGATSYVVSIFDNNFNNVAQSRSLSRTNWRVDALTPGETYFWEVAATTDGKEITAPVAPAPRAQFKILEASELSALSKLKQQKPVSHLALGLLYTRLGLVSEAEGEFRKLVKENPDSALAKKLLRTVQAWSN